MEKNPLNYQNSGVDQQAGDLFVDKIASFAKSTHGPEVLAGIGGFAALFSLADQPYKEPLLVSGTDGVGTKVLLAHALDRLDSVGIDLVAMCVNDVLTLGAKPLFFLDYLAMGKLDVERAVDLVKGITAGCREAQCALVGGETAEMPGVYAGKEFDLAGFVVGIVEKSRVLDGKKVKPGDVVIGLASSGVHSNGFSFVRRILLGTSEKLAAKVIQEMLGEKHPDFSPHTLGEILLTPTRIYVQSIHTLLKQVDVHGLSHITGGGLPGNVPRILPEGTAVEIRKSSWTRPKIFSLLQERGRVKEEELYEAFNMGIGMVAIVSPDDVDRTLACLHQANEKAFVIGKVIARKSGDSDFVLLS